MNWKIIVAIFTLTAVASANTPFTAGSPFKSGTPGLLASSLAVADVNGDGKLDVAVIGLCATICGPDGLVDILLGNGNGTFQTARTITVVGYRGLQSVALADVNGDGKPDLLVIGQVNNAFYVVGVLFGNGDGTFQTVETISQLFGPLAVADVNGDGRPDILGVVGDLKCRCQIGVLLGNGDGTFQGVQAYDPGGAGVNWIAVADVNADGKLDLVVANYCSSINSCASGSVGLLLGNGDGTFGSTQPLSVGFHLRSIAVADVNGDRKLDLLLAAEFTRNGNFPASSAAVLLGNGDGTFQAPKTYDAGGVFANGIAVADVNGDGKPDLLVANGWNANEQIQPALGALFGNGDGTFQTVQMYNSSGDNQVFSMAGASAIAMGDVNGDGRPDVLLVDELACSICQHGAVSVLLRRQFSTTTTVTTSPSSVFAFQPITFIAKVTPDFGSIPDGQIVSFHFGATQIGTGTTMGGVATLTTSTLKAGTYAVNATYAGNLDFKRSSASVSQVVGVPSTFDEFQSKSVHVWAKSAIDCECDL